MNSIKLNKGLNLWTSLTSFLRFSPPISPGRAPDFLPCCQNPTGVINLFISVKVTSQTKIYCNMFKVVVVGFHYRSPSQNIIEKG